MIRTFQKYAPTISILLLFVLIVALFFSPPSARLLSTIIIVFGIGTAILFTVHNNWEKHKEGELTRPEFIRNTIIDLLGLALIMGGAVWLGRLTGIYIGLAWGNVAGIIVAMAVGFIVAFLVGKVWGKVAEPVKA
ncbi:MAG: hypothetical protein ACT6FF_07935 [Methanosarcinaceae archaeon]